METDIIVSGFKQSIEMHNLRYKRYLGDGDSSVFMNIRQAYYDNVNSYKLVEKIECKNHAVRCLNKNMRLLLRQTEYPLPQRRSLESKINEIGKYCVYAIEGAKEASSHVGVGMLRVALRNCLEHVYGCHDKCQVYLCKNGTIVVPTKYKKNDKALPKANATSVQYRLLKDTALWKEIEKHLTRLVTLSDSLIHGQTTNRAECFQGHMAKLTQGKRKNVNYRGAYQKKKNQAILASKYGSGWSAPFIKMCEGKSP